MPARDELTFTLRLLTPAFAGSTPSGTRPVTYLKDGRPDTCSPPYYPVDPCGIRVPTLRGVLELWHRSRFGSLGGAEVYARQARVFGSAEAGQGLSIRPLGHSDFERRALSYRKNVNGLTYLGYGPLQLLRVSDSRNPQGVIIATSHNQSGCHDAIPVERGEPWFRYRAAGSPAQLAELRRALLLLHLFGGIGSRSRRGWGSVAVSLEKNPIEPAPRDPEALKTWFEARLAEALGGELAAWKGMAEPEFSAFSPWSRVLLTGVSYNHLDVLDEFCRQLKAVRAVMDGSPIAKTDAGIEKRDADRPAGAIRDVPRRLAFGLPYHPQHRGRWDIEYLGRSPASPGDAGETVTRRASPLLLKVFPVDPTGFVGVALFLRSRFFGDPKMKVGAKGRPLTQPFPGYQAIDTMLDDSGWKPLAMPR